MGAAQFHFSHEFQFEHELHNSSFPREYGSLKKLSSSELNGRFDIQKLTFFLYLRLL